MNTMTAANLDQAALLAARADHYSAEIARVNAISIAFDRAEAAYGLWERASTSNVDAATLSAVETCYADALDAAWASDDENA